MKLEILQVPDCPNVAVLEDRIHQALDGTTVEITHRVVTDQEQAAAGGMTGSPTLLIDGSDPFAVPGATPSCRVGCTAPSTASKALHRVGATGRIGPDQQQRTDQRGRHWLMLPAGPG
ncbi:hypothetical protein ACFYTS_34290 [Nocardia sp. NPDC004151]|uniref:hypothetical protein n=1 Tax=Nocardia sp. NPDC004151 TaxID=3364304 RepID=UPI0036C6A208